MATFPSLQALSRSYDLTPVPSSAYESERTGVSITFLHGTTATNRIIRIGFPSIKLADADAIGAHYLGEKQHGRFPIPTSLWQSHNSLYDVTPANQLYKYNRPPSREYEDGGLYTVTVELRTVL